MVSGGFNGGEDSGGGSETLEKLGNAGKSAGRAAGRGVKKAGKAGINAAGNALQSFFQKFPKKLMIFAIASCLGFTGFFIIAFFATDQDGGENPSYVDNNNTVTNVGSSEVTLSNANAACLSYYETLSKQKSVYQLTEDGNLILASDDDAKTDYFNNDDEYYIDPNLLYAMNKYIFGDTYVLPELFLNPVNYDEDTLTLKSLTDDNGNLTVSSNMRDSTGKTSGKTYTSVSDYGIASVLAYKTETMTEELKGTYVLKDVYNEETGEVEQTEISEAFSFILSSEDYDVLDTAITMAGSVTYNYTDTSVKSGSFASDSSSSDETENVYKILYDTKTIITGYYAVNNYGDIKTFATEEEMQEYLDTDPGYVGRTEAETYQLYKYRSQDSGVYTNFVDFTSVDTYDCGNDYIYDYLTHFSIYKPVMTRSYDTLATITSRASSEIYQNVAKYGTSDSSSGTTTGSGDTYFEQLYNGSARETIETIWDGLLQWGYSEEQAAAVLGNMTYEASFNTGSVNSIGAAGICQWYQGRRTTLESFAKSKGTEWTDLVTQIQFACMELDMNNTYSYASNQWQKADRNGESLTEYIEAWQNGNDVAEMAKAVAISWERPWTLSQLRRDSKKQNNCKARQNSAVAAYNILHGQTFGHEIEVISPKGSSNDGLSASSSVSSVTYQMSEKDRETFYAFYTAVDLTTIYDGDYKIEKYDNFLTSDEVDEMITLANAYIEGVSLEESSLSLSGTMWSGSFINDLSGEYDDGVTLASTLEGIDISTAEELADLDFLFPVDLSGYKKISSRFGPRTSPTAGASTNHKSIDISCSTGTAIYAVADGTVITSKYSSSAGYWIVIDHGTNAKGEKVTTSYMHNSELLVSVGDTVTRGQQIAKAGSTGYSTGPHSDFRITINGINYNPIYVFGTSDIPALKNGELTTLSLSLGSSYTEYYSYSESSGFTKYSGSN